MKGIELLTEEIAKRAIAATAAPPTTSATLAEPHAYRVEEESGELEGDEVCTNSHIISADTIIAFTEDMDSIMLIFTLLSSVLQLYVIYAAAKHIQRKTSDKCLHVFLLSMTVADFLLTALCYPVELAPRAGIIRKFPRFVSAAMHMLCWIALIVSSLSLVFLNLDKLFFFRFPLRYSNLFTRARAIYLVSACWLFSTTFVLFAWATESFHCVDDDCITLAIFPNRLHIYLPFMIFVGVFPTVTSLVVAIYIMKVVAEHRTQIKAQELLLRTPRDSSPSTVRSHSAQVSAKMRTFYFIFMTTVFTALTLLPYRFAGLQRSLNPQRMNECLTIFLYWLMIMPPSSFPCKSFPFPMVNPLLTVTVLPQYRINFVNALLCRKFRGRVDKQREQYTVVNRVSSDIL
ncbi:hypothetical protein niasHS_002694 [Heterodera schachtii]|uniref:G-protein coupled receptors family 1 profile domain-containing protein n=1 Tax=Heterodera schachtii TaxID=97005 RepID=A0ABD2K295_HETSC